MRGASQTDTLAASFRAESARFRTAFDAWQRHETSPRLEGLGRWVGSALDIIRATGRPRASGESRYTAAQKRYVELWSRIEGRYNEKGRLVRKGLRARLVETLGIQLPAYDRRLNEAQRAEQSQRTRIRLATEGEPGALYLEFHDFAAAALVVAGTLLRRSRRTGPQAEPDAEMFYRRMNTLLDGWEEEWGRRAAARTPPARGRGPLPDELLRQSINIPGMGGGHPHPPLRAKE